MGVKVVGGEHMVGGCFVSEEDGWIWKLGSGKAVARNVPRGSSREDKARDVIGVYGI